MGAGTPASGNGAPVRSLYVHVPFCFHKCHYCDFYSIVDRQDRQEAFTARLIAELAALAPLAAGAPLETIFVGGGTPTLLAPRLWSRLLKAMAGHFDLSGIRAGAGEFSVECNPETASAELFDVLRAGGVNRLSIGAQSFDPRHLKTLERWHDPASVPRAVEHAARAGIARRSVDLIFAIPGQTLDDWRLDLGRALALDVEHLSCYALTYEPRTAMTARLRRGAFEPAPDDLEADMYLLAVETLAGHGLERYEVSNFARAGGRCAHNLAYWRQRDWLAAGPSASGHVAGHRWKNSPRLDDYLDVSDAGHAPCVDHEPPDARRALAERIMTGVRLSEGLAHAPLLADAGDLRPGRSRALGRAAEAHVERGWLDDVAGHWRPTDSGFLFADRIAADLMGVLR